LASHVLEGAGSRGLRDVLEPPDLDGRMMRLSRQAQPDLLLAKVEMGLMPERKAVTDVAIEVAAGLVLVGIAWTFAILVWVFLQ
jgi:hypothetical protein